MSKNKNTYKFDNMEAFRKLKTNIEFSAVEKPIKVVNITSSCANEGKSTVAFHLAQVYAAKYKKGIGHRLRFTQTENASLFSNQ